MTLPVRIVPDREVLLLSDLDLCLYLSFISYILYVVYIFYLDSLYTFSTYPGAWYGEGRTRQDTGEEQEKG